MIRISATWVNQVLKNKSNYLQVKVQNNGEKVVEGSLIYKQNVNEEQDNHIFHFYITKNELITVDLNLSIFKHINLETIMEQINQTENAVEGFIFFLGELLNEMLIEIDKFEDTFKSLIWSIKKRNKTGILEKIYERRHDLLIWKGLLLPIKELEIGLKEADFNGKCDEKLFARTSLRIERASSLLHEYEGEMDSIINLEEVISSHRGNEIMKTLTVMTTIFTPVSAFGALWGMNFKHMPEIEWKFGYLVALGLIVISTFIVYAYLKVKGWTGDLLKGKRKGLFFK